MPPGILWLTARCGGPLDLNRRVTPAFTAERPARRFAAILAAAATGRTSQSERPGRSMTNGEAKIRRTLHFKFTLTGVSDQMVAMIKSAAPLYQMFGDAHM